MKKVIELITASKDKKIDTMNKKAFIDERTVDQRFSKISEQIAKAESMKIDPAKAYQKGLIGQQIEKYQQVIEKKLPFINELLSEIIPVAAGNVYLIGGITGGGKSTTVANIIIPILDSGNRIFVVTNEERRSDVFSRVACRNLGQSFFKLKRGLLHAETRKLIAEECEKLEDVMTVIGTDFQNNSDFVCTPEGLKTVFENLATGHDVILFDYYQNITISNVNDDPQPWVHQATFANFLNIFKNGFDGPIFVMSQLMEMKDGGTASFKERIEGRKSIANVAPVHIEIRPNKEDYTTLFKVWKDRLTSCDGYAMRMGFDKESGRYVPEDEAFKTKSASWIAERLAAASATTVGTPAPLEGELAIPDQAPTPGTEALTDELDFDNWTTDSDS